jgi:hypothetical protein
LSHWAIWRPSIAAGTTGQTSTSGWVERTIPPGCWEAWRGSPSLGADLDQPSPAHRIGPSLADRHRDVAAQRLSAAVVVDHPRHPLDLPRRQPQGLAEVAHDPLRAVGRKGSDQRRALGAVALVHARDQLLADVAGEVEVDVGHRAHLLVQEAAGEQSRLDRVDVREPGQVADDRADARAAPPPGGQGPARRLGPADLDRDLAGQLEQVAVQQEEAGEAKRADDPQLLFQPTARAAALASLRVAVVEQGSADLGQAAVGAGILGARVAVAELAGHVEAQPLGQPPALGDRLGVVAEAHRHRRR